MGQKSSGSPSGKAQGESRAERLRSGAGLLEAVTPACMAQFCGHRASLT